MSGASKPIKTVGNLIAIGYPASSLLYFVWLLTTRKILYWDGYNPLNVVIILLVIAGFLPFLLSIFIADVQAGWRILISLLAFPLLCSSALLWLDLPYYKQVREAEFGGHKYLLAYHHSIYGEGAYEWHLFECAPSGILCKPRLLYTDEYGEFYNESSLASLLIDARAEEMHVTIDDDLFFTVGYPSRSYVVVKGSVRRGSLRYTLSYYEDRGSVTYNLYECSAQYACTPVPFAYSLPADENSAYRFFVTIDQSTGDILVMRQRAGQDAELIFSYGDQPHCYLEGCSFSEE